MTSKGIRKLISLTAMKKKKKKEKERDDLCTHNGMYITNIKYLCLWCRVTECRMNGKYGIQDNKTHPIRTEGHTGATRSRYQVHI